MNVQLIPLSLIRESGQNSRGKINKDSLTDLISSIKEKGILVPIIIRPKKNNTYEVLAGNRRFLAAKEAKLKEIPAIINDLNDEESKEINIIENLQREDVHPMDEGATYRNLIENFKYKTSDIALRVGKSEQYVRYRLFITNLIPEAAEDFRNNKFTAGHASIIAQLSPEDQKKVLKDAVYSWQGPALPVEDLKDWIEKNIYKSIKNQPWLKNKEANEYIGLCTLCPPNNATLFGEIKEGECTDFECWKLKMKKYLDFFINKKGALRVSEDFGMRKGTLYKNQYAKLGSKKSEHCENAKEAVVKEGDNVGKTFYVCVDPKCKEHGKKIDLPDWFLKTDKKEKGDSEKKDNSDWETRNKKEREERRKEKIKEAKEIRILAEKFKYPLESKEQFQILFEIILSRESYFAEEVLMAHDWEPEEDDQDASEHLDILLEKTKDFNEQEKFRIIIEILLNAMGEGYDGDPIIKKIKKM